MLNIAQFPWLILSDEWHNRVKKIFSSLEYYISMCREEASSTWIEIDDIQTGKKQWPRGAKGIYILFLHKIVTKNVC